MLKLIISNKEFGVQVMVSAFISCLQTGSLALQAADGAKLECVARLFAPYFKAINIVAKQIWDTVGGEFTLEQVSPGHLMQKANSKPPEN